MINNLRETFRKSRALALRRKTVTIYVPVDYNIYYDGLSFRVRVTKNKFRVSKNFKRLDEAKNFRNTILRTI